jgi:hypothetical protein
MSLQLFPSGGFEITLKDGSIIKGQFNTASLKRLALFKGGLGFTDTIKLLEKTDTVSGFDYIDNLLQLVKFAAIGDYTDFDVAQWVEEMGGFDGDDFQKLLGHYTDAYVSKKKMTDTA